MRSDIASKSVVIILSALLFSCAGSSPQRANPKVIISTDIGGDDPDDYQSLVHFLVYADRFEIAGLISSPPSAGRKEHIDEVLEAYQADFPRLKKHSTQFPEPASLFQVVKQGATDPQGDSIPRELSEGAQWIVERAREDDGKPVYVLVWGSMTDVAQAVHHAPDIKKNIRIYSIGSWNTRQDPRARDYLYENHPDLWWIENDTTFRGMYMGGMQENDYHNRTFVEKHVKDHGALGDLFWEKKRDIKMGDTPSVLYLLHGNPEDPGGESWGGAFVKTGHSEHYWTDNPADSLIENDRRGAKTVNRFRKDYLNDWANRMDWLTG